MRNRDEKIIFEEDEFFLENAFIGDNNDYMPQKIETNHFFNSNDLIINNECIHDELIHDEIQIESKSCDVQEATVCVSDDKFKAQYTIESKTQVESSYFQIENFLKTENAQLEKMNQIVDANVQVQTPAILYQNNYDQTAYSQYHNNLLFYSQNHYSSTRVTTKADDVIPNWGKIFKYLSERNKEMSRASFLSMEYYYIDKLNRVAIKELKLADVNKMGNGLVVKGIMIVHSSELTQEQHLCMETYDAEFKNWNKVAAFLSLNRDTTSRTVFLNRSYFYSDTSEKVLRKDLKKADVNKDESCLTVNGRAIFRPKYKKILHPVDSVCDISENDVISSNKKRRI